MTMPVSVLLTDLYQLTMLQSYWQQGFNREAVFEFFVRRLPPRHNFVVAMGLEQVIGYLETLAFSEEELEWLRGCGFFEPSFVDFLAGLTFTGSVHAMPEGTVAFPQEPLLRVTAPLIEAQLVESRLINLLQYQTLVATKAVRCVLAAPDRLLVDFGMRRAHGAEAALLAARASYLAGFAGTSNVLAGKEFEIPIYGTMAHSYILAHGDETQAFLDFARSQPDNVVLLIDTFDTEAAAHKVVALAPRLRDMGIPIKAVRLDSGDLVAHAKRVRTILDVGGLQETRIFCSGDLDESELSRLLAAGAPIDGFGVGTRLVTASDQPYLECAYKLQSYAGVPRRKRSEGKATWPGAKQVFRRSDNAGCMVGDHITLEGEVCDGSALLQAVMVNGRRSQTPEPLAAIRERLCQGLNRLPMPLKSLASEAPYRVEISAVLQQLAEQADKAVTC